MTFLSQHWPKLARLVAALALVIVAFGHGRMDAALAGAPDLAAYSFPDGSVPVICFTGDGDHSGAPIKASHCDGCPVAAPALPVAPAAFECARFVQVAEAVIGQAFEPLHRRIFPPQAPPRAPPAA